MAKTVELTWLDPSVRADGSPLSAAEIASVKVLMSADAGANFTELGSVGAGAQAFAQTDLPDGTYIFKVVVVDTQVDPKSSSGVTIEVAVITVVVLSAPGDVTNLTATVV